MLNSPNGTKPVLEETFSNQHYENIGQVPYSKGIFDWSGKPMSKEVDFIMPQKTIVRCKKTAEELFVREEIVFKQNSRRFNFPHFVKESTYEWLMDK